MAELEISTDFILSSMIQIITGIKFETDYLSMVEYLGMLADELAKTATTLNIPAPTSNECSHCRAFIADRAPRVVIEATAFGFQNVEEHKEVLATTCPSCIPLSFSKHWADSKKK